LTELPVHRFRARDGQELAYRELGSGFPVVLLHGFTSSGPMWVHSGLASALADRGFRVLLPDLRGHGASEAGRCPPDILVDDGLAFADQLGLDRYSLGGYSLGARVAARMLVRGARPERILLGGQGLAAMQRAGGRGRLGRLLTALAEGRPTDPEDAESAYWITRLGADPQALLHVLASVVPTREADLAALAVPALVAVGTEDLDHADGEALAELLAATFVQVPGDHYGALVAPEFTAAAVAFLAG